MENIIVPCHISRSFIQSRKDYVFVYSNDLHERGGLGQAWSFAGEPNAFMVPTLIKYCSAAAFFYDENFDEFKKNIDTFIDKIPRDESPIIVCRKIGRGCSRMNELAPKLYSYLMLQLDKIKYPNVTIKYS